MSNDFILKENIINWINIAVKRKQNKTGTREIQFAQATKSGKF